MPLQLCHWDRYVPLCPGRHNPTYNVPGTTGCTWAGAVGGGTVKHSVCRHEHTKMTISKIGEYLEESWVVVFMRRGWGRPPEVVTFKLRFEG